MRSNSFDSSSSLQIGKTKRKPARCPCRAVILRTPTTGPCKTWLNWLHADLQMKWLRDFASCVKATVRSRCNPSQVPPEAHGSRRRRSLAGLWGRRLLGYWSMPLARSKHPGISSGTQRAISTCSRRLVQGQSRAKGLQLPALHLAARNALREKSGGRALMPETQTELEEVPSRFTGKIL